MSQNSRVAVMGKALYSLIKFYPDGVPKDKLETWWRDMKTNVSYIEEIEHDRGYQNRIEEDKIRLKFNHTESLVMIEATTKIEATTLGIIFSRGKTPKINYVDLCDNVIMTLGKD